MKLIFSHVLAASFWSQPLWAVSNDSDILEMAALFEFPCRTLEIPKPLVLAIAEVESGLRPWTLNIAGRSFHFDSKVEALLKAQEARAAGRSFDVGLMQVNDWWLRKYGLSLEAALDPSANIYLGGWILKQELDRHGGDVRAAVGAYHSPNPVRASRYAQRVLSIAQGDPPAASASRKNTVTRRQSSPSQAAAAPLLVASKHTTLAQGQSMKVAVPAAHNSMKVKA